MTTAAFPPSIELARLYEKTSARGTRYMVGRLGLARITLLPGDTADDGTPTWRVLLQESTKSTVTPAGRTSNSAPPRSRQSIGRRPDASPMPDDPIADLWSGSRP